MDTTVERGSAEMIGALVDLAGALQDGPLPLELPGVEAHRQARAEMLDQLRDYLLPRLAELDAPLLVVVGGSTGVGKSTLVSSLVGERVTEPGVLRPTTRLPVLVHNPADWEWFATERILPRLMRTATPTGEGDAMQLAATPQIPAGLALIDAPDFDSVEHSNRALATQLLAAADLWLFVTSAARYADSVPWDHLRIAVERGTMVAIVLNRVPERGLGTLQRHLTSLMQTRGLSESPLFVVPEAELASGLVPQEALGEVSDWLRSVAEDPEAKRRILDQTLDGAIRALARRSYGLAEPLQEQVRVLHQLRDLVEASYLTAIEDVDRGLADGSLLRGEALMRWQEFALERTSERIEHAALVSQAIATGLQTLLVEAAESAAERAATDWAATPAGHGVLDRSPGLARASARFRAVADERVAAWQAGLPVSLEQDAADAGAAVALAVAALGSGATAEVAEKLLDARIGSDCSRVAVAQARTDLLASMTRSLGEERQRFADVLDDLGLDAAAADRVRTCSARVDDVRFASQVEAGQWR